MQKKVKIALTAVPVLVVIALTAAVLLFTGGGPDPAQFEHLRQPQVRRMDDQRVLVVEARGEPNAVAGEAFSLLFKTYFKLKGVPKGRRQPAPRARWPLSPDTPKEQWVGRYAMPVPEDVNSLPSGQTDASGLHAELTTWEYGQVAEILHVGPYDREGAAIQRLMQFIKDSGYRIIGEHEEEYLKGPGLFLKGNPEKYLTIVRYRVSRVP
jgi:hypothetical protein